MRPTRWTQRFKEDEPVICPSCNTQCDDSASFCQNCGRRVSGGKTPWLLIGCPLTLLLLVAIAAIVGFLFTRLG